ncbi:MAG: hypothetical protein M1819_005526 [Sarea resinae]|nr:MAG: hypothetical protein M1819_005526 [Sarea resinae]
MREVITGCKNSRRKKAMTRKGTWNGQDRSMMGAEVSNVMQMHRSQSFANPKGEPFSPHAGDPNNPGAPFAYPAGAMIDALGHSRRMVNGQNALYPEQQNGGVPNLSLRTAEEYGVNPANQNYGNSNRDLDSEVTPTPQHLIAAAQALQSSPSSLSSCSSQTGDSGHSQDIYYSNVQSIPPQYQMQAPRMHHDPMAQYQPPQAVDMSQARAVQAMNAPPIMPQAQYQVPHPQAPPMWYDTMAYQQPIVSAVPQPVSQARTYNPNPVIGDFWIKDEDPGILLPSARAAMF